MKLTITRRRYDVITNKEGMPIQWDVSFDIEHEDGITQYAPTTIYRNELREPITEATVMFKAAQSVIPGQIAQMYQRNGLDKKDYFDVVAENLTKDNLRAARMEEHTKKLKEESETALEESRSEMHARGKEKLDEAIANLNANTKPKD